MAVLASSSDFVLVIRRYMAKDRPETLELLQDAKQEDLAKPVMRERQAWTSNVIEVGRWLAWRAAMPTWVAEFSGRVIGFLALTSDGEVNMLHVHSRHTDCGVEKALLDEAERAAREAEFLRLYARVNPVAQSLFRRQGFTLDRDQDAEFGNGSIRAPVMEKLLEPVL